MHRQEKKSKEKIKEESNITCYNYNKSGHLSPNYLDLKKSFKKKDKKAKAYKATQFDSDSSSSEKQDT